MWKLSFLGNESDKFLKRHQLQVFAAAVSGRYPRSVHFFIADYQHIGDFLQLGISDFQF
jgi:chemotaxis receptor (MCP) glutamine deamidase CheD